MSHNYCMYISHQHRQYIMYCHHHHHHRCPPALPRILPWYPMALPRTDLLIPSATATSYQRYSHYGRPAT